MAKLATPKLVVYLSEDDDAEPFVVQSINADLVLTETTARKHSWGSFTDAPIKMQTFLAYAALKRKGILNGETFEQFEQTAVSITTADGDPAGSVPTRPDPGSG
jgi:hypothetical protein